MRLRVSHDTTYRYAEPIGSALQLAHLHPRQTPLQRCEQHQLDTRPEPGDCARSIDAWGNERVWFSHQAPLTELSVHARSVVHTLPPPPAHSTIAWTAVRERFIYHASQRYAPANLYVFPSVHVRTQPEFAAYARPCFGPDRPLLDGARELMQRIHAEFRYDASATDTGTPPAEALAVRAGVCQDFAHVFISCLRSLGLAARYVSGYLLTQPPPGQPRLTGADASHAWASVWLPDLAAPGAPAGAATGGWYDLDPTNQRDGWHSPGEDYVRLAIGRDYADVAPIRGVILGGSGHDALDVAVTVEPIDD